MRRALLAIGLVVVAIALWWTTERSTPSSAAGSGVTTAEASASGALLDTDAGDASQQASNASQDPTTPEADATGREELPRSVLTVRVIDGERQPIAGAALDWIGEQTGDVDWEPAWHATDWGPLERARVSGVTSVAGEFAFEREPEHDELAGSVIWARAPGYLASCAVVEAGERSDETLELQLPSASPIHVRVVDASGAPVEGATVRQFGLTPQRVQRAEGDAFLAARARR